MLLNLTQNFPQELCMTFFEEAQSYVEVFICRTSIAITASSLLMRFFSTQGPVLLNQALQTADV